MNKSTSNSVEYRILIDEDDQGIGYYNVKRGEVISLLWCS